MPQCRIDFSYVLLFVALIAYSGCSKAASNSSRTDLSANSLQGTSYYVSSADGSDSNSGTSPDTAWATLKAVNSKTFAPGDKILFKAGTHYTGRLAPKGSGAEGSPIIIDRYGQGTKPRIDGGPADMEAVLLYNVQYWEVNNLEVTNRGPRVPWLAGVKVHINDFGTARHIYLRNLYVHDVDGPLSNHLHETGSGIYWKNEGEEVISVFDDLRIENCHVKHVNCRAIQGHTGYPRKNWHPSVNVIIRGNLIEDIGGAGITTFGTEGCLIEYNKVDNIGLFTQGNGIHPYLSDNTVIQYNEVSNCRRGRGGKWKTEGWGFNSDGNCRNSLFQYNYSHDNEGGYHLIIGAGRGKWTYGCQGTVIRYNISVNDGYYTPNISPTFHFSGNVHDTYIYNNTIYIGTRRQPIELFSFKRVDGVYADNTRVYNNIFYVDGEANFIWGESTNNMFSNNVWYGKIDGVPEDPSGITSDPKLVDPQHFAVSAVDPYKAMIHTDALDSYKLLPSSPCIGAGRAVDEVIDPNTYINGGRDFWGNPVPEKNPDIGACQYVKPTL